MALVNGGNGSSEKRPAKLNVRRRTAATAESTPAENASLLSSLGSGTMSGLHTVGSILSTPSRVLWGGLNGIAGGEGGFGNMNPIDSTGGIELSHVLGNLGIIQKNDPNKWEWMDPVRGLIDIAGDPTTYLNPLTMTTKGIKAIQGAGRVAQAAPDVAQAAVKATAQAAPDVAQAAAKATAQAPASMVDQISQHFPEFTKTGLVPFKEITERLGHTPDDVVQALQKEVPDFDGVRGFVLHQHDLPSQIVNEGKQADFHWGQRAPDDLLHGKYGVPFIGASLRPEVAKQMAAEAAQRTASSAPPVHQWADDGIFASQAAAKAAAAQSTTFDDIFRTADQTLQAPGPAAPRPPVLQNLTPPVPSDQILAAHKHPFSHLPLVDQIEQGYRGVGGVQLPFMDPLFEGFTGPTVAALAKKTGIPQALDYIGKTAPVRAMSGLFDARTRNVVDKDLQPHVIRASENANAFAQNVRQNSIFDAEDMKRLGIHTPEHAVQLRAALENVPEELLQKHMGMAYDPHVLDVAKRMASEVQQFGNVGERFGFFNKYKDPITENDFFPRGISPEAGKSLGGAGERRTLFESNKLGTAGMEAMWHDPKLKKILSEGLEAGLPEKKIRGTMRKHIVQTYGPGRIRRKKVLDPVTGMEKVVKYINPGEKGSDIYDALGKIGTSKGRPVTRAGGLAKYLYNNPAVLEHGLFTNHPGFDLAEYATKNYHNQEMAKAVTQAAADHIKREGLNNLRSMRSRGEDVVPLKSLIGSSKMKIRGGAQFVDEMARLTGIPAAKIKNIPIKADFAAAVQRAVKSPISQAAVPEASNFAKSLMTWWKARVLAHPSTRARDYMSAVADNYLQKHATPAGNAAARDLLGGKQVTGVASEDPLLAMQMQRAGYQMTPETETMAMRAALGAGHPVNHGIVGDLPNGQRGAGLEDILQNSPGDSPRSWGKFAGDMKQILTGHTYNPTSDSWEPTPWKHMLNPAAARGAFGYEHSLNPRYVASEYVAQHGDTATRMTGTLGQVDQGQSLAEAMRRTNASKVNYDPNTYSDFERKIKNYGIPFWSFLSRKGTHTAQELATNPGGLTAQMTKASNRASQGDPSAPDEVLTGASIPFRWPWVPDDGSKNYLSGLGLMHEDPINKMGAFLGGDIRSGMRGFGGSVGPFFKPAIEAATGKSLFNGEDLDSLDPPLGRTLSNLGVATGLMKAPDGEPAWKVRPVNLGDHGYVDSAIGYSPFGRDLNTLKMATDVRPSRSVVDKLLQLSTGYRTTSITPERQQKVIRKRFEQAAKGLGAREISNVSFIKEQMESIRKRDPKTADKLERLQAIVRQINQASRKKKAKQKK